MNNYNATIDILLNRLQHVRNCGDGWRAQCPVHEGDNRQSLKIDLAEDGRILIYCFAQQCPPLEIVNVCGLEIGDLFPERITHHSTPEQRQEFRQKAQQGRILTALDTLRPELAVVTIAGKQLREGTALNEMDKQRLQTAVDKIDNIRGILNAR